LEDRRAYWFTEANLSRYFEVARDVLINAGVAEVDPDYDPNVPFSHELIITAPERICYYDETKMELDCTKAGKGKIDRTIRDDTEDDNTAVVTKSDTCGVSVCGRLGNGRALPVCIVFKSGYSFDPAWAPHYVSEDIFDNEGNPLPWRYINNPKGLVNE